MSKLQAHNEEIINAPISKVWAIITDINLLGKINPGVITAKGRKGTMTEKLVELVHEQKTVWVIENDTMGMKKMLKDPRFCFYLEKVGDSKTKITNESYYLPANLMAKIMNALIMKKMMGKIQGQILTNIKTIAEK